jgi:competence protein ComEC
MFFLNQNPFIRAFIPFAFGVIISLLFSFYVPALYISFGLLAAFALIVIFGKRFETYRLRWMPGSILVLFFLFFGYSFSKQFNDSKNIENYGEVTADSTLTLIATVDDDVSLNKNSVKTILRTECVIGDNEILPVQVKILSYFSKDSLTESLRYGDRIILRTQLKLPPAEMNPYSFNYRNYLAQSGIYHTCWVAPENVRMLDRNCGNPFRAFALKLRNNLLDILQQQLGSGDEYAVAAAIVTGYRAALDADLRQAFSNAGAMHVMCVSGLHVGVIFLIISWLLRFLSDKNNWQRFLKVFLILLVIWLFALLTGFSASVLRASTMFSFVALGMIVQRKVPVYNSLAASAFFLLLINPMFLFQVGFQLSYLAVIGIVALFPLIQKLLPVSGKFTKKVRDLIAVSVAAQIATAPFSLYYFNQFPNYFVLANMIVVPLAGLIIYTAIPALLLHSVPLAGKALAWLLGMEMKLMNGTVQMIDSLPGAVTSGIYISLLQTLLLYLIIYLIVNGVHMKKKIQLGIAFALLIGLFAVSSVHKIQKMSHAEVIIPYGTPQTVLLAQNGKCYVISSETDGDFRKRLEKSLAKYFTVQNIDDVIYVSPDSVIETDFSLFIYPLIRFGEHTMYIEDNRIKSDHPLPVQPDVIIVENNPFLDFEDLKVKYDNAVFVFTPGNKKSTSRLWEKLADNAGARYYNVNKSGAFVLEIE